MHGLSRAVTLFMKRAVEGLGARRDVHRGLFRADDRLPSRCAQSHCV
jgi:hypothetical protein